uniref:Sugar transporter-like protein n=1 Tax=Phakopsora pachyrhizi TaxID=170000 RepID=A0A0S1MIC2_PHAPC
MLPKIIKIQRQPKFSVLEQLVAFELQLKFDSRGQATRVTTS